MQFIKKYHIFLTSILLFLIVFFGMNNCANINKVHTDSLTRLTIQYATLKFVGDDEAKKHYVQDMIIWVHMKLEKEEYITLSLLDKEIRSRIPWKSLIPSDKFAIEEFLTFIHMELESQYNDLGLNSDQVRLSIQQILIWIEQAINYV